MVLITGPSSSGKTTFCKRLSIQLLACGLRPMSFSTDDYFVNRVDTPKLPNGDYDFDNIETVEYSLLEEHLLRLMQGERQEDRRCTEIQDLYLGTDQHIAGRP